MHSAIRRIHFEGLVFDIYENVYEPAEDSFLFAENLCIREGDAVLDLGTGSGILAVLAAKKAGSVVAIDLNPFAIRCALQNAKLNHFKGNVNFLQSDLFAALDANATFDLILFNAPYLPSEQDEDSTWIGRSWAGGVSGREVVDRFITEVPSHLKFLGRVQLMQSTLTSVEETLSKFREIGLAASVKAEQQLPFFETLTLIEAKRYS
jgi:release factor glutamine methyltransferase